MDVVTACAQLGRARNIPIRPAPTTLERLLPTPMLTSAVRRLRTVGSDA